MKHPAVVIVLMLLLSGPASAQEEGEAPALFSEQEFEMFRGAYYDTLIAILELAERGEAVQSLENLGELPEASQMRACSIVIDFQFFSLVASKGLTKIFSNESIKSLYLRLFFDIAEVEWTPLDEVSLEDQPKVLQAKDYTSSIFEDGLGKLSTAHKYCLDRFGEVFLEEADYDYPYQFTPIYASVPVEFRLKEVYRSQLPFLGWVLENIRESEEKQHLTKLIASIKRKYLLE